jgi:hypothetical protein
MKCPRSVRLSFFGLCLLGCASSATTPAKDPRLSPAKAPVLAAEDIACSPGTQPFEACQPDGWVALQSRPPFAAVNAEADPIGQAKKYLLSSVGVDGDVLRAEPCIAAGSDATSLANRVLVEQASATGSFSQQFYTRLVDATVTDLPAVVGDEVAPATMATLQGRIVAELRKQLQSSQAVSGGDAVYVRLNVPSSLGNVQAKTPLPELAGCDGKAVVDGFSAVAVKGLKVDAQKLSTIDVSRIVATARVGLEGLSDSAAAAIETRLSDAWGTTKSAALRAQWTSNLLIPLAYRLQGFGTTPATQTDARRVLDTIRLITQPRER